MKGSFPAELLDEILTKLNIVDVVSEFVPLKKAGKSFKACCPFHEEKTPSFFVHPEKQIFHCFGCGEGGNVFTFLMKAERLSFPESVALAAERAGVTVTVAPTGDDRLKKEILTANKAAAAHFGEVLLSPAGRRGLEYLQERNIHKESIAAFGLGYAGSSDKSLAGYAQKNGLSLDAFSRAGLIQRWRLRRAWAISARTKPTSDA